MSTVKWLPLESNPDVINIFLEQLGVPSKWKMSDMLSFEEEYIYMIPNPVLAILLLFPFSEKDNNYCKEQEVVARTQEVDSNLYFMNQSVSNACGTIALIHAIANNVDQFNMKPDSIVRTFIDRTKHLAPKDKANAFEKERDISEALAISSKHSRELGEVCHFHFIALLQVNGKLYELDGRKNAPVFHGSTTPETFVKDCAYVCKKYIERDPHNPNFSALIFGAA